MTQERGSLKNLAKALAAAILAAKPAELDKKSGQRGGYPFASNESIMRAAREALASNGLAVFSQMISLETVGETETKGGRSLDRFLLTMDFELVHADSGESRVSRYWAEGQTSNDKALLVATTICQREYIRQLLLLPRGGTDPEDQPEQQEPERQEPEQRQRKRQEPEQRKQEPEQPKPSPQLEQACRRLASYRVQITPELLRQELRQAGAKGPSGLHAFVDAMIDRLDLAKVPTIEAVRSSAKALSGEFGGARAVWEVAIGEELKKSGQNNKEGVELAAAELEAKALKAREVKGERGDSGGETGGGPGGEERQERQGGVRVQPGDGQEGQGN